MLKAYKSKLISKVQP